MPRCSLCGLIDDDGTTMLALDSEDYSSKAYICQEHLKPEAMLKPEIEVMELDIEMEDDDQEPTTSSSSEVQETVKQYFKKLQKTSANMNLKENYIWDITDPLEIIDWTNKQLVQCLLDSEIMIRPSCQKCGNRMRPKFRRNCVQNTWLCRIKGKDCSSSSMKTNSIFTAPHINIKDQVRTIIYWINGTSIKDIKDIQASERQLSDMYKKFRFECWRDWRNLKIGGEMRAVEIKTFNFQELGFQKFGFEEEYFETFLIVFLERVKNGRVYVDFMNTICADSVNQILKEHILPDTYILCDEWRGLNCRTEQFSNTRNCEIQKAVEIFEMDGESKQELAFRSQQNDKDLETCDEFFEYVTKGLVDVWPKMSKTERDSMFAERIMKFNGRENQFRYFWQLLVRNQSLGSSCE